MSKIPNADDLDKEKTSKPNQGLISQMLDDFFPQRNDKTSIFYRVQSHKKAIGFGAVGVVALMGLTMCGGDDNSNDIKLTGTEAVTTDAPTENIYNEQQAEFDRNNRLQKSTDGVDITQSQKRIIRQGRFDLKEIKDNPQRFKILTTQDNSEFYIDIVTGDAYDMEGNLVDYQHEPAYIEQAPVQYNNVGNYGAGGGLGLENYSTPEQTQNQTDSEQMQTGQISPQLQSTLDRLNANNQQTYNTLVAIDNARVQNNQAYDAQLQQAQAQAQAQLQGYQQLANQQIQSYINQMYRQSSFSTTAHNISYRGAGFNTTSFASANNANANSTNSQTAQTGTNSVLLPRSVLRQGTVMLVAITSEVDTDKTNLVHGIILDGYYSGAKVQGTVVRKQKDIGVNFNLIFPTNPRLPVVNFDGIALDLVTNHDGVATDVKNHYIQNYMGILAKSALTGYGNAYASNTGTTVINRSDGTTITTTDGEVSTAEIRGQIYASLAERLNQDTEQWGTRPPTYKIKKGTVLAIQLQSNLDTNPNSQANSQNGTDTQSIANSNTSGRYAQESMYSRPIFNAPPPNSVGLPQAQTTNNAVLNRGIGIQQNNLSNLSQSIQ